MESRRMVVECNWAKAVLLSVRFQASVPSTHREDCCDVQPVFSEDMQVPHKGRGDLFVNCLELPLRLILLRATGAFSGGKHGNLEGL